MAEIFIDDMSFRIFSNHAKNRTELRLNRYLGNKTSIKIPKQVNGYIVTVIGKCAFEKTCVEEIYYPDSIYSIEDFAFLNCKQLKTVISYASENAADEIDILPLAFNRCENLIMFQSAVSVCAWYQSFEKCTALSVFSAKILGFGYRAFAGSLLTELHFADDVLWGKGSFEGMPQLSDLYFDGAISPKTCKSYMKYIRRKRLHVTEAKFNHMELVYEGTEILS